MSFWVPIRDEDGRTKLFSITFLLIAALLLVGGVVTAVLPLVEWLRRFLF